jgi:putative FmdB family regulatory protein
MNKISAGIETTGQIRKDRDKYGRVKMPVYEFECDKGTVTEKIVPMGTRQIQCPCCRKKARKILSRCTFELKGGGWYADGYASKKPPSAS